MIWKREMPHLSTYRAHTHSELTPGSSPTATARYSPCSSSKTLGPFPLFIHLPRSIEFSEVARIAPSHIHCCGLVLLAVEEPA